MGLKETQRPRNTERSVPNKPTTPKPIITKPIGTPMLSVCDSTTSYVGIIIGGGDVNVGNLVGGISTIN